MVGVKIPDEQCCVIKDTVNEIRADNKLYRSMSIINHDAINYGNEIINKLERLMLVECEQ